MNMQMKGNCFKWELQISKMDMFEHGHVSYNESDCRECQYVAEAHISGVPRIFFFMGGGSANSVEG
jgi:hypothetical protein